MNINGQISARFVDVMVLFPCRGFIYCYQLITLCFCFVPLLGQIAYISEPDVVFVTQKKTSLQKIIL